MKKKIGYIFLALIFLPCLILVSACNNAVDFKINFMVDGVIYDTVKTQGNTTISMPNDPTKEGYVFDGWYWDKDVWNEPFTVNSLFNTPLKKELNVYARFVTKSETETPHVHLWGTWKIVDGIKQKSCEECGTILCKLHYDYENNIITLDKSGNKKTYVFGKSSGITTDPTIKVFPSFVEWNPDVGQNFIKVYFYTSGSKSGDVAYTITGPNGEHPIVEDVPTNDGVKMFRAEAEGKYTLRTSFTKEDGTSTIENDIYVGDCVSPIIEWVNIDGDLISEARVNNSYRLDVYESLIFIDNQTKEDELLGNVNVTLISPDGETIQNVGNGFCYEWRFSKVGDYTLKIKVKDNAGNVKTLAHIISVKS